MIAAPKSAARVRPELSACAGGTLFVDCPVGPAPKHRAHQRGQAALGADSAAGASTGGQGREGARDRDHTVLL